MRLSEEIRRLGGTVLDVNTNCAMCIFLDDIMPIKLMDDGNIEGYYHDIDKHGHKNRLETNSERLKTQATPKWIRTINMKVFNLDGRTFMIKILMLFQHMIDHLRPFQNL